MLRLISVVNEEHSSLIQSSQRQKVCAKINRKPSIPISQWHFEQRQSLCKCTENHNCAKYCLSMRFYPNSWCKLLHKLDQDFLDIQYTVKPSNKKTHCYTCVLEGYPVRTGRGSALKWESSNSICCYL